MPTLIRLLVALLFLGGLGYAGLFALTIVVQPGEKEITVKIPQRDLMAKSKTDLPMPSLTSDSNAPVPAMTDTPTTTPDAPIAPGADQDTPE